LTTGWFGEESFQGKSHCCSLVSRLRKFKGHYKKYLQRYEDVELELSRIYSHAA
jgi:hypothetical protein